MANSFPAENFGHENFFKINEKLLKIDLRYFLEFWNMQTHPEIESDIKFVFSAKF